MPFSVLKAVPFVVLTLYAAIIRKSTYSLFPLATSAKAHYWNIDCKSWVVYNNNRNH